MDTEPDRLLETAVVDEILARYPLLALTAWGERARPGQASRLPAITGALLGILDSAPVRGTCVCLPSIDGLALPVAALSALSALGADLASGAGTAYDLQQGELVRLFPEDWDYLFDGIMGIGGRQFIRLLKPDSPDREVHFIPVEDYSRLSRTAASGKTAPRKRRPSHADEAPIERLLQIRSSRSLADLPLRILLLSGLAEVRGLAEGTAVRRTDDGQEPSQSFPLEELLEVSRLTESGRIDRKNLVVGRTPAARIGMTHSLETLAAACKAHHEQTLGVVVDGASRVRNLQAFDEVARCQKLLVLAEHGDLETVAQLAARGCAVWTPSAGEILMGNGRALANRPGPYSATLRATLVEESFELRSVIVPNARLEAIFQKLQEMEALEPESSGPSGELIACCHRLLWHAAEWYSPTDDVMAAGFRRKLAALQREFAAQPYLLSADVRAALEQVIGRFEEMVDSSAHMGAAKLRALGTLLDESQSLQVGIATRTAAGATSLRDALTPPSSTDSGVFDESRFPAVFPIRHFPINERFDLVVLGAWSARHTVSRLINSYCASEVTLIGYPFETRWLSSYEGWRTRRLAQHATPRVEVRRLTGLAAWPQPSLGAPYPATTESESPPDPFARIRERPRKRKRYETGEIAEDDVREGRYVGFHGSSFCYLTKGHHVPVITELVAEGHLKLNRVPLRTVDQFQVEDFVLFRDQGDHDIIAAIARVISGGEEYDGKRQLAGAWRAPLRSLGSSMEERISRLREVGVTRTPQTIRNWLRDDSLIAPGEDDDIAKIAEASGDSGLKAQLDDVCEAAALVRAAHIQAGAQLTQLLLTELPGKLGQVDERGTRFDFGLASGWVVCVSEIDELVEERPYWEVNRLLWEDEE